MIPGVKSTARYPTAAWWPPRWRRWWVASPAWNTGGEHGAPGIPGELSMPVSDWDNPGVRRFQHDGAPAPVVETRLVNFVDAALFALGDVWPVD